MSGMFLLVVVNVLGGGLCFVLAWYNTYGGSPRFVIMSCRQ